MKKLYGVFVAGDWMVYDSIEQALNDDVHNEGVTFYRLVPKKIGEFKLQTVVKKIKKGKKK